MTDSILEVKGIKKCFGALTVLENVNFVLKRGEFKSIIGPNGAGKTTLYNLISGAMRPTEGNIIYNGRDITNMPPYKISTMGLSRSYQVTNIFPGFTVEENIRIAAQSKGKDNFKIHAKYTDFKKYIELANEIIESVKLNGKGQVLARDLPHSDSRKLELGIQLALGGDLILLDEPTAGVSMEEVPALIDIVKEIKGTREKSILLIEHKIGIIMDISDTIAVLQNGVLIADNTPELIRKDPAVQAAYFGGGSKK